MNINKILSKSIIRGICIGFALVLGTSAVLADQPSSSSYKLNRWSITGGSPNIADPPMSAGFALDASSMGGLSGSQELSGSFGHYPGFLVPMSGNPGCTDPLAVNYDPLATVDDGSCYYGLKGDMDLSGVLDVLDVILLVSIILEDTVPTDYQQWAGDFNSNGSVDVVDIVDLVDEILNPTVRRANPMSAATVTQGNDWLQIQSDAPLAGIQIEGSFGLDMISSDLPPDWQISYNESRMLIFDLGRTELVSQVNLYYAGDARVTSVQTVDWFGNERFPQMELVPEQFSMGIPWPNPFNPVTQVTVELAADGLCQVVILDLQGRQVARLMDGMQTAGRTNLIWNAGKYPSGLYFIQMTAGNTSFTRKVLLVK